MGVKSTCIANNNAPCFLYFREIQGLWNVLKYLEYVVHTKTNNIYLHAKVKIKMQMKKAQVIIENEDKELTFGLIVKNL